MKTTLAALSVLLLYSLAGAQQPITVFLAGDSTMAEKLPNKRPETGWGEQLQNYFDETKVRIVNHAQNGRSTRSFIAENRWQVIVEKLKLGDYVFIQFGHNDSKENTDRYASPEDYRKNLVRFVADVRQKKGIPVLLTPVMRRRFDEQGVFYDTHGEYPNVVRSVAAEYKVAMIDMHRKSEGVIKQYGVEESRNLFLQLKPDENANYPKGIEDNTHFSPLGAKIMAGLAVDGIRELKLGLRNYVKGEISNRSYRTNWSYVFFGVGFGAGNGCAQILIRIIEKSFPTVLRSWGVPRGTMIKSPFLISTF